MNAKPAQTFDPLAPAYDDAFTNTTIGRYLRGRVHARLQIHFHAGAHILELGCGTGEDALFLARQGIRVTATDASSAMLEITRAKAQGSALINAQPLDLNQLPLDSTKGTNDVFDGAFSSFGPLNCVDDLPQLARWLAMRVRPGGIAAFGVMSPFCIWEPLWHGLHLDLKTAARRWGEKVVFQPQPDTVPIRVYYPTIRQITRAFGPCFRRTHVEGLGLCLPPSDVFGVIEKRPRLMQTLMRLERYFAPIGPLALLADHYWIEFERTSADPTTQRRDTAIPKKTA